MARRGGVVTPDTVLIIARPDGDVFRAVREEHVRGWVVERIACTHRHKTEAQALACARKLRDREHDVERTTL